MLGLLLPLQCIKVNVQSVSPSSLLISEDIGYIVVVQSKLKSNEYFMKFNADANYSFHRNANTLY